MKKIWVNRNYTFHMAVRYAEPFQIDPNKGVEDRFHLNIGYYYVSLGDGKFHLASEEVAYTFFFSQAEVEYSGNHTGKKHWPERFATFCCFSYSLSINI
jgi:hypothetical protein